jgi:hypothetical protein
MVTIEALLAPQETVLKQEYVHIGLLHAGDLYLTTMRVLFFYRTWGKFDDYLSIPLTTIRQVRKRWASLIITAAQDYTFTLTVWAVQPWVDAITAARHTAQTAPRQPASQNGLTAPAPIRRTPPQSGGLTCPTCGRTPVFVSRYGRYYCNTCQQYLPS